MSDFNITFFEACELLNRSKKSISRYIRRGLLHPQEIKSKQGTLEYRFSKDDIEAFKIEATLRADQTRPDKTEGTDQTGYPVSDFIEVIEDNRQDIPKDQTGHKTEETGQSDEVINLLKETTGLLKDQLKVKDDQIKGLGEKIDGLIERDKETNYILKNLQDKILMLEQPKPEETGQDETGQDEPEPTKTKSKKRFFKGKSFRLKR